MIQDSHANFLALRREKRDNILNAALREFADRGYDLASTNAIVGAAGISKGALFHYFSSKKELYFFLVDYVFAVVRSEFYEQIGPCDGDLLRRYQRAARLKGAVYRRHPMLFAFNQRLTREKSPDIAAELAAKIADTTRVGYQSLLGNLDERLFRPDVPAEKLRELTVWALENYGTRAMKLVGDKALEDIDMDALNADFDTYVEILRRCFYRQEEGKR